MEIETLKKILESLPIDQNKKDEAISKISIVALEEAVRIVDELVKEGERELGDKYPEASKKYNDILNDYSKSVEETIKNFNSEMAKLDSESNVIDNEVLSGIDKVKAEELHQSILN